MRNAKNQKIPKRDIKLINLTPHDINIISRDSGQYRNLPVEVVLTIPPSGTIARVSYSPLIIEKLVVQGTEIPVTKAQTYNITNLPEPKPGIGYIVSKAVADAAKDREDLYILFGIRRKPNGSVIGGSALSRL